MTHVETVQQRIQATREELATLQDRRRDTKKQLSHSERQLDRAVRWSNNSSKANGDVEQLQQKRWTQRDLLNSLTRNIQEQQDILATLERDVDQAKEKDRMDRLKGEAREFNELAGAFNEKWAEVVQIGQKLLDNNVDNKLKLPSESATPEQIGLKYVLPQYFGRFKAREVFKVLMGRSSLLNSSGSSEDKAP